MLKEKTFLPHLIQMGRQTETQIEIRKITWIVALSKRTRGFIK